jgi:RNA recognition motif-containing protein
MNIFVGDLSFEAIEADLKRAFEAFGKVNSVTIIKEKNGIKSRGFGFVDMPDDAEGIEAINGLNDKEFMGRVLKVSRARKKLEVGHGRGRGRNGSPGYKKGRRARSFMMRKAKVKVAPVKKV